MDPFERYRLTPKEQQLIELLSINEEPMRDVDIAQALGVKRGTVRERIRTFRDHLEKQGVDPAEVITTNHTRGYRLK